MSLERNKKYLNRELDQFNTILNKILPRYLFLIQMNNPSLEEQKELGELEHYLIEVNGKVAAIKTQLDQDLFGESFNLYYKTKQKALKGDIAAKNRLDRLRKVFLRSYNEYSDYKWN